MTAACCRTLFWVSLNPQGWACICLSLLVSPAWYNLQNLRKTTFLKLVRDPMPCQASELYHLTTEPLHDARVIPQLHTILLHLV
jgi:hypothetical protein